MDDRIRQGRNPEWRLAFEDRLGADARTRIRRAVKRGRSVSDPDEAAVAAGLARREQRYVLLHARIFLPIQVVFASIWLAWMLSPQRRVPVAFLWFWAAGWVTLVVVGPFVLWGRFRIAHRATEVRVVRRHGVGAHARVPLVATLLRRDDDPMPTTGRTLRWAGPDRGLSRHGNEPATTSASRAPWDAVRPIMIRQRERAIAQRG